MPRRLESNAGVKPRRTGAIARAGVVAIDDGDGVPHRPERELVELVDVVHGR
jgi:hypothetical protein